MLLVLNKLWPNFDFETKVDQIRQELNEIEAMFTLYWIGFKEARNCTNIALLHSFDSIL